jgi:L-fucose isomerase-like protein
LRLGRIGENPNGFETCLFNSDLIQEKFGVEIVQYDLDKDLFPRVRQTKSEITSPIYKKLSQRVEGLGTLDAQATNRTLGVYHSLKEVASQDQIDGYAVRCWPEFFTELGCAACGAMSLLSDEMIPCSCEADINGTITQLILQSLSGEPAFGTDVVSLNNQQDAVVIWHCGLAPLSMADPHEQPGVTIHSNRKLPLLFEFSLKPGTVTVARLSEATGEYRLVVGKAEIISGPKSFSGTSGLLRFPDSAKDILDLILSEGLEHHISLTYGDFRTELIAIAEYLELPVLELEA